MRGNFMPFKVKIVRQSVVIILVENEESHANRATVRIHGTICHQVCVVYESSVRYGAVKRQKDQLSCIDKPMFKLFLYYYC